MRKTLLILAALLLCTAPAGAGIIGIDDPGGTVSEIGARIRWGVTGFEASVYDVLPSLNQDPTLNPVGTPVWQIDKAYKFQISFSSLTGALGLSVDFNRDDSFGAGESITRSAFTGLTSYAGYGFNYLSISGNESGSTARSTLNNLAINGTNLASLSPDGLFLQQFYKDSSGSLLTDILITGDLTFLTSGTAQERPAWDFRFRDAAEPVPEPISMLLFGTGLVAAGGYVRRRFKK
jgi:hypothetical protein